MKLPRLLTCLSLMAVAPGSGLAQQAQPSLPLPPGYAAPGQPGGIATPGKPPEEKLFSLDFPGGPVPQFVAAVEKATGEPFNVIIPEAAQDLMIPPVRVRGVTLSPLLGALSATSEQRKAVPSMAMTAIGLDGRRGTATNIQYQNTGFKFVPTAGSGGSMVWQLVVEKVSPLPDAPAPTPMARFYQLKPNLEAGLKVEDITTVAQTAWRMMKLKDAEIPELKVHEESGILIAVGSEAALSVIESVLRELPKKQAPGTTAGPAGLVPGFVPPPTPNRLAPPRPQ